MLRGRHDFGRRTKHEIYSSPPRRRPIRKDRPKTHGSFDATSIVDGNGPPETKWCKDDRTDRYQEEAKKLLSVKLSKDRIRGHYLLYDIPNGLDDTVARFVMAVTLRYVFENPGESSVSGNCHSARAEKGHLQKCVTYAAPILQHFHHNGIIYVRQLLPAESMACELSSIVGVTNEFVLLSGLLLSVLHQIGGRHLRRKYLTATCRQFLETQNELKGKIVGDSNPNDQQKFTMASLLGQWATAGSDEFNDDDNPGGLWLQNQARCSATKNRNEARRQEMSDIIVARTNRSWVTSYTAKILSENESRNPAICPYRHGKLLDGHVLTKK